MTREDVRQQLAKNPLEWSEGNNPGKAVTTPFYISWGTTLQYEIEGGNLYIRGSVLSEKAFCVGLFHRGQDPKDKAEAHRLDLVCRMLGVTE
ncbi:hypothetical protein [uncultured Porphyromonas sp.]|uniref:hypothetical protein n=1 Tax=uncultured Porphyromonas sp. TaxID=159274 RepID=UPI002634C7E3|nr:hypothetical protein [uncultured Porphyromonas sp.]